MYSVLGRLDIIGISEHWLHGYELNFIRNFHPDFNFYAIAAPQAEDNLYCVPKHIRGHGGAAIAWRKSLDQHVKRLTNISCHRVVGIQIRTSTRPLCILSVYLPTCTGCTDDFRECLDQVDSILEVYGLDNDVIDLNADLGAEGGPMACTPCNEQGRILSRYLNRWNFLSVHLHLSPSLATSTYLSEAHGSSSTIDHILCPSHLLSSFSDCTVAEEIPLNMSDHFPILSNFKVCLTAPGGGPCTHSGSNKELPRPNWDKLTSSEIANLYTAPLEEAIRT